MPRYRSCLPPAPRLIAPPSLRVDDLTEDQLARFLALPPELQADLVGAGHEHGTTLATNMGSRAYRCQITLIERDVYTE